MIAMADLPGAVRFLNEVMGFSIRTARDDYAYLTFGNAAIRLVRAPPDADMQDEARQVAVYLDVEGLDAYYDSRRAPLEALPEGRLRKPFDQDYGQREFHVIHQQLLIFVGEPVQKKD